jgi:hypothetical protein
METRLIDIDDVPCERELLSLTGEKIYGYYANISNRVISALLPDIEIWSAGGRRGKYHHGYHVSKTGTIVDIYLSDERMTCEFHFRKRAFAKILAGRALLCSGRVQEDIDFAIEFNKEFDGGYTIGVIVNDDETCHDMTQIIDMVSAGRKSRAKAVEE